MKLIYVIIVWLLLATFWMPAQAQEVFENYLDGVLYVKVDKNSGVELVPGYEEMEEIQPLIDTYEIDSISRPFVHSGETLKHIYRLEFSDAEATESLIDSLEAVVFIQYAEKMPLYTIDHTPNDLDNMQWYLDRIDARDAWTISKGSPDVTIAIVDNGVRLEHEDLKSNIWDNPDPNTVGSSGLYFNDYHGYDVADNNNDPNPPENLEEGSPFNHGTHCAGIASAVTNNDTGIASIGYQASIMAVKCTPDDSEGNILTHAYEGIDYSMNAGADIISMSFGSNSWSITNQYILQEAHNRGIVLVGAAGNNDSEDPSYPGAHEQVINVGATNMDDEKAFFSNYGEHVDLMAPGVSILSTLAEETDAYGQLSGTSMSTPLVAGIAALIIADDPEISNESVRDKLIEGAENIDDKNPEYEGLLGAGLVNAASSLGEVVTDSKLLASDDQLKVYPNPALGEVTIKYDPSGNGDVQDIQLYNLNGKQFPATVKSIDDNKMTFDAGYLDAGFYIIRVHFPENTYNQKLLIR